MDYSEKFNLKTFSMGQKSESIASVSKLTRVAVLVMTYAAGPTMTCRVTPMARRLRPIGIDLTLFALSESFEPETTHTTVDGEKVRLIGQAHFRKGPDGEKIRFGPLDYLREVRKTARRFKQELKQGHFDLVQVFTTDPGALYIAVDLKLSGYRVTLDVDDSTYGMGVLAGYPKPVLWVQWLLEAFVPRLFKLSGATRCRGEIYPGMAHLQIPIALDGYHRELPPCSRETVTVILVGNMAAPHLHLQVVEALPEIVRKNPRIRFCFIGTGEKFRQIQERVRALGIESSVELPGWLSREETLRRLGEADIGICPMGNNPFDRSRMPMKIYEYMAAGLCVLTAPVGEVPYVIRHEQNGWLYRPDDMADFAHSILKLASEPDLVRRLAAQGRSDVRAYGPDQAEKEWYSFYAKAARR